MRYEILDYLDPIDSTCLGLTCKTMYFAHLARYGKAWQNNMLLSNRAVRMELFRRLRSWMGPEYLMFVIWGNYPTFVHREDVRVEVPFSTTDGGIWGTRRTYNFSP